MPTDKQLAANRSNALKSTGPKSDEGKARSARNAITHGIRVSDVHLTEDHETLDELEQKRQLYLDLYQPRNIAELDLVKHIVLLEIRLDHSHRAYRGLLNDTRNREFGRQTYRDSDGNIRHHFDSAAAGPGHEDEMDDMLLGHSMSTLSHQIELLNRYENRLFNRVEKLTARLEKLKSRPALQQEAIVTNEPISTDPRVESTPEPTPEPAPPPKPAAMETQNDLPNLQSPRPEENRKPNGAPEGQRPVDRSPR